MAFIRTIPPSEAEGAVEEMYQEVQGALGYVPNWAEAFSLRPAVRDGWVALLSSIRANLSVRTYELATLAAARALRSSYCALAHGRVLADKVFDVAAVTAIMNGADASPLEPGEQALMAFAEKVALQADSITPADTASPRLILMLCVRTAVRTRKSSISQPQPRPAVFSASSSTRWACRRTLPSTISIPPYGKC